MHHLRKLVVAVAAGVALSAPIAASADTSIAIFSTQEVDADHPGGAIEGSLRISIAAGGTVSGNFIADDSGRISNVTGGLDGNKIHFTIGNQFPIVGTYDNGTIVGYQLIGSEDYKFTATRNGSS